MSRQLFATRFGHTSSTLYNPISGDAVTTSVANVREIISCAGRFFGLDVALLVAPGLGKSWKFELWVNDAATGVTCTISDTDKTGSDYTNSVVVAEDDDICIKATPTNTPSSYVAANVICSFFSTTPGQSLMFGGSYGALTTTTADTEWLSLAGINDTDQAIENFVVMPVSTPGSLKRITIKLATAPGATSLRKFEIMRNGAGTGLALNFTTNTEQSAALNKAYSAGDTIYIEETTHGTVAPASCAWVRIGLTFEADTPGLFMLGSTHSNQPSASVNWYSRLVQHSNWSSAAAQARKDVRGGLTLTNLYVWLSVAPGIGKSRRVVIQKQNSDTGLDITVPNLVTTGNVSSDVLFAEREHYRIKHLPASTPANSYVNLCCTAKMPAIVDDELFHAMV